MDYCGGAGDVSSWHCARAIALGIVSVISWLLALVALYRVAKAHRRTQAYALSLVMLSLAVGQSAIDWVERLGKRESRLQLLSIALRMLETIVASAAYVQTETTVQSKNLIRLIVFPFNVAIFIASVGLFIASCTEDDVTCEHPYWISMGCLQLGVSLLFVLIGCRASREVSQLIASNALSGNLIRKRRDLWLLMTVFLLASIAQVSGDAWRMILFKRGHSCEFHETHFEEIMRTLLAILSFDLPVWAILVVFYYRQRKELDPELVTIEVSTIQLLSNEDGLGSRADHIILDTSGIGSADSDNEDLLSDPPSGDQTDQSSWRDHSYTLNVA